MKFRLIEGRLVESKEDQLKLSNHVGQETAQRFLKMKNSLKSPYNDIYYWLKQDKDALANYLDNTKGHRKRTGYQQELDRICAMPEADDVEFICEQDGYKIYKINTPEASVKWGLVVGGRAKWCISGGYVMNDYDPEKNPEMILEQATKYFQDYLNHPYWRYYFVFGRDTKYAICELYDEGECDVWDQQDNEVGGIPGLSTVIDSTGYLIYQDNYIVYDILDTAEDGDFIRIGSDVDIKEAGKFTRRHNIAGVEIPNTVTFIDDFAFHDCKSLKFVDMPDSVKRMWDGVFENCESLYHINLSSNLKGIPDRTFNKCKSLPSIKIPDTVVGIGESAFESCTSLKAISLPSRITDIESYAFCECISLKTITLPKSINYIGMGAFDNCSLLTVECPSLEIAELVIDSGFDGPIIDIESGKRIQ